MLAGRDTLAIMPTGGGKSLCYQLPALLFDGLTVVVSPLISLMQDQVDALRELGVPAAFLNSTVDYHTYVETAAAVREGRIKLLYLAPETLLRPETLVMLDHSKVACLTIDEAHCISSWGHDFRPEYRQLLPVRRRYPQAVCVALTATATRRVQEDIKQILGFGAGNEFVAGFNRPNLYLAAQPRTDGLDQILAFLDAHRDQSGIIYCHTRKEVEMLAEKLRQRGVVCAALPCRPGGRVRREHQRRFSRDEAQIMVATIAFGMGINKSNIRFILHAALPENIENYYQQIGRAGRDGLRADCLLLWGARTSTRSATSSTRGRNRSGRARKRGCRRCCGMRRRPAAAAFLCSLLRRDRARSCVDVRQLRGRCQANRVETVDVTEQARLLVECVRQDRRDVRRGAYRGRPAWLAQPRGPPWKHDRLPVYGQGRSCRRSSGASWANN